MTAPAGRLAFLLPHFWNGGAERVALRLIQDAIARGHPVDLLLMEAKGPLLALLPPEVRVINLQAPRVRQVPVALARYLLAERPVGLQAFMWPLTVAAALARRLARSRTRLVLSDHTTLSRQYAHFGRLPAALLRRSIGWIYPWADARVIVSRDAARDLARLSGLAPGSIEVIYNPVAAPVADAGTIAAADAAWPADGARILTVGSLYQAKNHRLLIDAFARLADARPAALVILGEGPLRDELAAHALVRGVAHRVAMPGFVANPGGFYATADLFVLSSDFEGYGNVLVEAMHAGLKVVSTDCESGPREILADGAHGTLVPCGDADAMAAAMSTALDAPADAPAARRRAEALSGQETSDRYLALMTSDR